MRPRSVQKTLRDMYPQRTGVRPEFPDELETDVVARYEARYASRQAFVAPWLRRHPIARYAMGSLLLLAVLGGACQLPTSTQVEMGQRMTVRFLPNATTAEAIAGATTATATENHAIERQLQAALAAAGADKARIGMRDMDGGLTELHVLAWGQHVSQEDVESVIQQQLGRENIVTVNIEALSGTLSETLGQRIGRRLFDIDVSGETAENLRAAILANLAAQGFDGNARVEVQDDGSVRKITVEAGTADGSREIADEIILDKNDN